MYVYLGLDLATQMSLYIGYVVVQECTNYPVKNDVIDQHVNTDIPTPCHVTSEKCHKSRDPTQRLQRQF